jgi:hypothetical protein
MTTTSRKQGSEGLEQERKAALAAMKRARRRAEEIATKTGTALIQAENGKPVRVIPPTESRTA